MVVDAFNRPIKDLRISVTDRCNFRCTYCMPFDEYPWTPTEECLSFEEIARLARIFVSLGVEKIRLTGGEPLLRAHLEDLIASLAAIPGLDAVCLTTNGSLLADRAAGLKQAGLSRVNVSVDTLDPDKFQRIRRRGDLKKVLDGIWAARDAGIHPIKLNTVVQRGVNDDDIIPLVEFGRANGFSIRFIEYMDVGNANGWRRDKVVPKRELIEIVNAYAPLEEVGRDKGSAPAVDYRFADGIGDIGVIASVTEPFCASCTRARLTADGKLVTCLFSDIGKDVKGLLRGGASDEELTQTIAGTWRLRTDRYSQERLSALNSNLGYEPKDHRKIEMITLGG